jgi:hypothetical protein
MGNEENYYNHNEYTEKLCIVTERIDSGNVKVFIFYNIIYQSMKFIGNGWVQLLKQSVKYSFQITVNKHNRIM